MNPGRISASQTNIRGSDIDRYSIPEGTIWQCPDCGQRWARFDTWRPVSERRAARIIRKYSRYDKPKQSELED